jgi:hypothetical protein
MFETVALWLIVIWAISGVWLVVASGWGSGADRRAKSANKSRSAP